MNTRHLLCSGLAGLLLASPLLANDNGATETFENNSNPAGWSLASFDEILPTGGNPDGYLHVGGLFAFAPILRTDETVSSDFTGDYRDMGVTTISLDAITHSVDFGDGNGFELSILLRDTKGTPNVDDDDYAYYVGPNIPLEGAGWCSYEFAIPSQTADAVPAGWSGGWVGDLESFRPGVTFSDVITNVDKVEVWFLHPAFSAIFQGWGVGVDNISIEVDGSGTQTWVDLGEGMVGSSGSPTLTATGAMEADTLVDLNLTGALANTTTVLVVGAALFNAPAEGGILVPSPDILIPGLPVNGTGGLVISGRVPADFPAGVTIYMQHWTLDPAGPAGFVASNGIAGTTR